MDTLTRVVSEASTVAQYLDACTLVTHHIRSGREVPSTTMMALAVKGHVIALETNNLMVSLEFLRVWRAEPGTMGSTERV
jgi:hypothetical protein